MAGSGLKFCYECETNLRDSSLKYHRRRCVRTLCRNCVQGCRYLDGEVTEVSRKRKEATVADDSPVNIWYSFWFLTFERDDIPCLSNHPTCGCRSDADDSANNFSSPSRESCHDTSDIQTSLSDSSSGVNITPNRVGHPVQVEQKETPLSRKCGPFYQENMAVLEGPEDLEIPDCTDFENNGLDIFASMARQPAKFLKPDTSRRGSIDAVDHVKVTFVAFGSPRESILVRAIVCTKNIILECMTSQYKNPRLLLSGGALQVQGVSIQLESLDILWQQEMDHIKMIVSKTEALRTNVLLVDNAISLYAQEYLLAKDISVVLNVERPLLECIVWCAGALVTPSVDKISTARFGQRELFHLEKVSEEHEPMKFYGSSDKPLGRYLQDDLFDQTSCQSCKEPTEADVIPYTHEQGNLTINVGQVPLVHLDGEHDGKILMWLRCLKFEHVDGILPATRRVVMSDAAWGHSFGKFLEMSFSNHATANRVASCGHSLQRDYPRYDGFGSMNALFRYSPIGILSVSLPPSIPDFNVSGQNWLRKEAAELLSKGEALYAEMSSVVYSFDQKLSAIEHEFSGISGLYNHVMELKGLLTNERSYYKDILQPVHQETLEWGEEKMLVNGGNAGNITSLERTPLVAFDVFDTIYFGWTGSGELPAKVQLQSLPAAVDETENPPLNRPMSLARVYSFDSAVKLQERVGKGLPPPSLHLMLDKSWHASGDLVSIVRRSYSLMPPSELSQRGYKMNW